MQIDNRQLQHFLTELRERFGLVFESSRFEELRELLLERSRSAEASSVSEYLDSLQTSDEEWHEIASRLTVPETYFFRIPDHFDAFAKTVLPERIRRRTSERMLRIASVGCASGEEPYTIAMVLKSDFPELQTWDVRVVGYDVSRKALERAKRGVYSQWSLRATPEPMKERFFKRVQDGHQLDSSVRKMVTFEVRNVLDLCDELAVYDVVFFRNVLIYFSPESARDAVACVANMLTPGGYLFIGTAETLRGVSNDFSLCHTEDAFYYQREAGGLRAQSRRQSHAPIRIEDITVADDRMEPVAEPIELSTSWMDVIRDSTTRVSELTESRAAPRPPVQQDPESRARRLQTAMTMFAQEQYAGALQELDGIDNDAEPDSDFLLLRAILLTNLQRVPEAEREAARVLDRDHLNAGAHFVLALCCEQEGKLDAAVEHDQLAAYLDPAFAMPHVHCGTVHRRRGLMAAACEEFERARTLLATEDPARVLLFAGGFTRDALLRYCDAEIRNCRKAV